MNTILNRKGIRKYKGNLWYC